MATDEIQEKKNRERSNIKARVLMALRSLTGSVPCKMAKGVTGVSAPSEFKPSLETVTATEP